MEKRLKKIYRRNLFGYDEIHPLVLKNVFFIKLIYEKQHGFVPGKSCVTNLIKTFDFLTNALSNGHNFDKILLDLSKAFDLVPHRRLINKKRWYCALNELTVWLEDILKDKSKELF